MFAFADEGDRGKEVPALVTLKCRKADLTLPKPRANTKYHLRSVKVQVLGADIEPDVRLVVRGYGQDQGLVQRGLPLDRIRYGFDAVRDGMIRCCVGYRRVA